MVEDSAAVYPDATLSHLDLGEREAITLTESLGAQAILIDDRDGRRAAAKRRLTVIGTLQILDTAAADGLIDLPAVLAQLQATTFRVSSRLLRTFLDRDAERKKSSPTSEKSS